MCSSCKCNVRMCFYTFLLVGVYAQLAAASISIACFGEADDILLDGWRREHVTEEALTKVLVLNSGIQTHCQKVRSPGVVTKSTDEQLRPHFGY